MTTTTTTLQERYTALQAEQPRLRIRDAAEKLGVSELELLELELGTTVTRLEGDWKALLKEVHKLGKVMALTRNEYAVHERKGVYNNISFMTGHNMGVAVNDDIDLRFLMWDWKYAYATELQARNQTLYSIQFFNKYGEAIHKIYTTSSSNLEAYEQLVASYRADDQTSVTMVAKRSTTGKEALPDEAIDVAAFQQDWLNLQDTHDFFPLLRKYELERTQALRLAPEGHAYKLSNEAVVQMFNMAAEQELPIMIFVGNNGCIQIHTGLINKLVPMDNWFNIMDPEFNLHLRLDGIAETWVTKKPTKDGIVTGVEVFDSTGEMIVQCFGKRKPGKPELSEWQTLIETLN